MDVPPTPVGRVPRQRLYEQIVAQLYEHISAAGLRPGDRLPPERELAARLGVSRASLAQALVALEVLGVIAVRHGDGVIVVEHSSDRQIVSALRAHRRDQLRDVIDARAALEVKLASLAAQRRTEADVRAMDAALAGMAADIEAGGRGVEGADRFHAAVTVAGRSPLLARLMQEISDLIHESRLESLARPGRPPESLAGHRRIADAIHAGDAAAAAAAMEAHLQGVEPDVDTELRIGEDETPGVPHS